MTGKGLSGVFAVLNKGVIFKNPNSNLLFQPYFPFFLSASTNFTCIPSTHSAGLSPVHQAQVPPILPVLAELPHP